MPRDGPRGFPLAEEPCAGSRDQEGKEKPKRPEFHRLASGGLSNWGGRISIMPFSSMNRSFNCS